MKRIFALTLVMMVSACAQTGNGFVQEPPVTSEPDPIITEPIDSRFLGRLLISINGTAKDLDTILEFHEKDAGKLIGYGRAYERQYDRLDKRALFIDYWQTGERSNADVSFFIRFADGQTCPIVLKGKLNLAGHVKIPKTTQTVCGVSVVSEATEFNREGVASQFATLFEAHFSPK
jgi:hypothetical protein